MLYFAYGSNMDLDQMKHRCPKSRLVGTARLPGYRFRINRRGVATIVSEPGGVVWGVLWDLHPEDEGVLGRYEGVSSAFYTREKVCADPGGGRAVDALGYIGSDNRPGVSRPGYIERVVKAALVNRLPGDYVAELRGWTPAR